MGCAPGARDRLAPECDRSASHGRATDCSLPAYRVGLRRDRPMAGLDAAPRHPSGDPSAMVARRRERRRESGCARASDFRASAVSQGSNTIDTARDEQTVAWAAPADRRQTVAGWKGVRAPGFARPEHSERSPGLELEAWREAGGQPVSAPSPSPGPASGAQLSLSGLPDALRVGPLSRRAGRSRTRPAKSPASAKGGPLRRACPLLDCGI